MKLRTPKQILIDAGLGDYAGDLLFSALSMRYGTASNFVTDQNVSYTPDAITRNDNGSVAITDNSTQTTSSALTGNLGALASVTLSGFAVFKKEADATDINIALGNRVPAAPGGIALRWTAIGPSMVDTYQSVTSGVAVAPVHEPQAGDDDTYLIGYLWQGSNETGAAVIYNLDTGYFETRKINVDFAGNLYTSYQAVFNSGMRLSGVGELYGLAAFSHSSAPDHNDWINNLVAAAHKIKASFA